MKWIKCVCFAGSSSLPAYAYVSYSKQNASYPNAEIWNINMTHGMVLLVHVVNYVAQHSPPTAHSLIL